jgi:hypothetical protein
MLSALQNLYKKESFLVNIVSDSSFRLKACRHSVITELEPVLNNFIKHLVKTKSKECLSLELTGQASIPYKITGKHLVAIKWRTTSSEACRPTLPKIELNDRKYDFLAFLKQHLKDRDDCK